MGKNFEKSDYSTGYVIEQLRSYYWLLHMSLKVILWSCFIAERLTFNTISTFLSDLLN